MDKRLSRAFRPIEVKNGPQGILSFYEGQTLEHEESGAQVIVLQTWDEGQRALLFSLDNSDRPPFEANASWAVGWNDAYLDGPRLVELYKTGEEKSIWAAYLPTFDAACDLWKYYNDQDGKPFELIVHCQNGSEYEHLEALGYFPETE